MRKPNLTLLVTLFASTFIIAGCSGKKTQPSGFLGDPSVYSAMKAEEELEGVMAYRTVPYPLAGYDSFIVPPVSIYLNEEGRKREIPEEELLELAQKFREAVIKQLGAHYRVTNDPAPRVAILRLAITDADPNIALMNIHPGTVITGGGLGGASAEFDFVDSVTGARVAAFMASSKGKRYEYAAGLSKWGHTESVLEDWAKTLGERVKKAHG